MPPIISFKRTMIAICLLQLLLVIYTTAGTRPYPVVSTEALARGGPNMEWEAALAMSYPGVSNKRQGKDLSLSFELVDANKKNVLARKDITAQAFFQKSKDGKQVLKL